MRTIASVGCSILGSGTVSTRTSRLPCQATAFISHLGLGVMSRQTSSLLGRRRKPAATVGPVRITTWNVNSVKQRLPRLLPWLDERRPDVVCLQETKLADEAFVDLLGDELADRAYAVAVHGEAGWNGVAILSRGGLDDVVGGLADAPG